MPRNKPVVTEINQFNKPVPTKLQSQTSWAFSFRFFNQIQYFGLNNSKSKWFVSLIERLRDLSTQNREEIALDRGKRDFYRYHRIDWESKNIPIQRKDLTWVEKNYLENEEEFPFYQFTISKANGRVVGFWNENHSIFFIVLLDPLHNLQPSKDFDFKVDDCYPLSCEYTSLLKDIEDLHGKETTCESCSLKNDIKLIPTKLNQTNAIVGYLDDDFLEEYKKLEKSHTLSDILQMGILTALSDQ